MNICLVRPKFPMDNYTVFPPLGLLTMAASFDKKHKLFFGDMQINNEGWLSSQHEVIAFTAFTNQLPKIKKHIDFGREMGVKSKMVVGGPAVTSNPEYAKSIVPNADILFAGDGEYFAENIEAIVDSGAKIIDYRNQPYSLENKKIPLWELTDYMRYRDSMGFGVETSRGCPMNCVMCCAHMIHGKQWVARKPEDVVSELKFLKQKYGCTRFYFADDNATVDPARWFSLMQQIVDAKLGLTLSVPEGIQAHHLDYETLKVMKEAGLKRFTIGAESGSQRVLDKVINKGGLTVEKIEEVVKIAKHLGMKPSCFFVIGLIGETLGEAEATVNFAQKLRELGAESCTVRNVIPIPETRLFDIALAEGFLAVSEEKLCDLKFTHSSKHLLKTPEWNPEQIDALVLKAKQQEQIRVIRNNLLRHPRASLKLLMNKPRNN